MGDTVGRTLPPDGSQHKDLRRRTLSVFEIWPVGGEAVWLWQRKARWKATEYEI